MQEAADRPGIPGPWDDTGGYTYVQFNATPFLDPSAQKIKKTKCSAWEASPRGDQRLRQLRWLSSQSVDFSREGECGPALFLCARARASVARV